LWSRTPRQPYQNDKTPGKTRHNGSPVFLNAQGWVNKKTVSSEMKLSDFNNDRLNAESSRELHEKYRNQFINQCTIFIEQLILTSAS
jgi:hypothetical protein